MRHTGRLPLTAELEERKAAAVGPGSAVEELVVPVGVVLSQPSAWRIAVPAFSTQFTVDPFSLGELKQ